MKSCSEEHANIVEKYSNGEEINSQQQQKLLHKFIDHLELSVP